MSSAQHTTSSPSFVHRGIRTSSATSARSGAAGAIAIEAPVFSPTSAHILANATAFRPSASGYAFRFTRMTGVRIASPGAEPPRAYLKGAGSCGRRAGLVVIPPAAPPHDHEEYRDCEDRDDQDPRERVQRDPR